MASCSSSDHPESSHPYHTDRSCSTTSLESQSKKRLGFLARLLPKSRREGLLPLPEGASLSSSSPPQLLPLTPLQLIHLPHLASMDTTGITAGDSTWAVTYKSPPLPPTTILWMPILQHPQPQSAQASSGTILPFHSAPTSQRPTTAHLSTEHLPHQQSTLQHRGAPPIWDQPVSTNECPLESIPSVEEPVASTLMPPSFLTVTTAVTGQMWLSSAQDEEPGSTANSGHESTDSSGQSHNLHLSYSHPLSRDTMSTSPTKLPERAPSRNSPLDPDTPFPNIPDEGANSESTPEPPQSPTDPNSTSDDTAWCHQILPENSYGSQRRHTRRITRSWVSWALWILCLWVTLHSGLGKHPSWEWLFYEEKPRTPIWQHSTVRGWAERSPPV